MANKRIALIEPNKERAEKLAQWCKEEGYEVELFDKLDPSVIPYGNLGAMLVDIYPLDVMGVMGDRGEINAGLFDSLTRVLSTDPKFSELYVALIVPKTAVSAMAKGVEAGADNFLTEFSDKQIFIEDLKRITSRLRPGTEKTRLLDLNLVNFFLERFPATSREDFFNLAPVVFNALIIRRMMPYIGETTVSALLTRLKATTGKQTAFMKEIKYQDGKIFMDGVDKASKEVSVLLLCTAFRDYIYAFVHLVRTLTSDILVERWDWERK